MSLAGIIEGQYCDELHPDGSLARRPDEEFFRDRPQQRHERFLAEVDRRLSVTPVTPLARGPNAIDEHPILEVRELVWPGIPEPTDLWAPTCTPYRKWIYVFDGATCVLEAYTGGGGEIPAFTPDPDFRSVPAFEWVPPALPEAGLNIGQEARFFLSPVRLTERTMRLLTGSFGRPDDGTVRVTLEAENLILLCDPFQWARDHHRRDFMPKLERLQEFRMNPAVLAQMFVAANVKMAVNGTRYAVRDPEPREGPDRPWDHYLQLVRITEGGLRAKSESSQAYLAYILDSTEFQVTEQAALDRGGDALDLAFETWGEVSVHLMQTLPGAAFATRLFRSQPDRLPVRALSTSGSSPLDGDIDVVKTMLANVAPAILDAHEERITATALADRDLLGRLRATEETIADGLRDRLRAAIQPTVLTRLEAEAAASRQAQSIMDALEQGNTAVRTLWILRLACLLHDVGTTRAQDPRAPVTAISAIADGLGLINELTRRGGRAWVMTGAAAGLIGIVAGVAGVFVVVQEAREGHYVAAVGLALSTAGATTLAVADLLFMVGAAAGPAVVIIGAVLAGIGAMVQMASQPSPPRTALIEVSYSEAVREFARRSFLRCYGSPHEGPAGTAQGPPRWPHVRHRDPVGLAWSPQPWPWTSPEQEAEVCASLLGRFSVHVDAHRQCLVFRTGLVFDPSTFECVVVSRGREGSAPTERTMRATLSDIVHAEGTEDWIRMRTPDRPPAWRTDGEVCFDLGTLSYTELVQGMQQEALEFRVRCILAPGEGSRARCTLPFDGHWLRLHGPAALDSGLSILQD